MIQMPVNSWSTFKSLVTLKSLMIQYIEKSDVYEIFGCEEMFCWEISLKKETADATDFEDNYISSSNNPLLDFPNVSFFNSADTFAIKSGKGKLYRVIYSRTGGLGNTAWTLYDNTAGSGTIIHQSTVGSNVPSTTLDFRSKFTTGLTLVNGSANNVITLVWE